MEKLEFSTKYGALNGHKWVIDDPKQIILLVTGMAEHSARYDDFASYLNTNGYSVFCLDHFGQGNNGKLGLPIDDYFFIEQEIFKYFIDELKNKYQKDIYMFAHSMGSFVTQGFIEKYSSSIKKVVLCGTNGRNILVKFGKLLANLIVNKNNEKKEAKILHTLSLGAYEKSVKNPTLENEWISFNLDNVVLYNKDPFSGFKCSNKFFKNFFNGLSSIQKSKNIKKIDKDLRIFIIGGDSDPVGYNGQGLIRLFKLYSKFGLDVRLKIYPHMRHEILNEKNNKIVYEDVLNFLKEYK